ncbi:hypothetical protein EYF80_032128 [Liparis tanakae]|uniref:Uncharacterized protein n=1 Tax=Liparis tanakae TaxID=230148 RepID=A0A4Z2GVW4_9TELE|nr:hypothetical protein EYF80_032128 [Liparis tanakae]
MMKNAQQMRTMLPMGLREVMRVSTTSFRPGARLITLKRGEPQYSKYAQDLGPTRHGHHNVNQRHKNQEAIQDVPAAPQSDCNAVGEDEGQHHIVKQLVGYDGLAYLSESGVAGEEREEQERREQSKNVLKMNKGRSSRSLLRALTWGKTSTISWLVGVAPAAGSSVEPTAHAAAPGDHAPGEALLPVVSVERHGGQREVWQGGRVRGPRDLQQVGQLQRQGPAVPPGDEVARQHRMREVKRVRSDGGRREERLLLVLVHVMVVAARR